MYLEEIRTDLSTNCAVDASTRTISRALRRAFIPEICIGALPLFCALRGETTRKSGLPSMTTPHLPRASTMHSVICQSAAEPIPYANPVPPIPLPPSRRRTNAVPCLPLDNEISRSGNNQMLYTALLHNHGIPSDQ